MTDCKQLRKLFSTMCVAYIEWTGAPHDTFKRELHALSVANYRRHMETCPTCKTTLTIQQPEFAHAV